MLIHLKRPADAEQIFGEVVSELAGADGIDERYILLFCELHRPSNGGKNHSQLLAQASQLRAQSSLSDFLPLDLLDQAGSRRTSGIYTAPTATHHQAK